MSPRTRRLRPLTAILAAAPLWTACSGADLAGLDRPEDARTPVASFDTGAPPKTFAATMKMSGGGFATGTSDVLPPPLLPDAAGRAETARAIALKAEALAAGAERDRVLRARQLDALTVQLSALRTRDEAADPAEAEARAALRRAVAANRPPGRVVVRSSDGGMAEMGGMIRSLGGVVRGLGDPLPADPLPADPAAAASPASPTPPSAE